MLYREQRIKKRLEQKLEREHQNGRHDPKTKLLWYPGFEEEVIKRTGSTARAADAGKTHALILLDLDDFKQWNNKLTYTGNDRRTLLPTAALLSNIVRPDSDLVSRFGGEEFAVYLSETDEEGAALVAERIQGEINAIRPDENSTDRLGATMAFMTFRQGDYPETLEGPMEYLSAQIIAAKEIEGKNQIIPASPLG